jgi:hypothetical protein
MFKGISTVHENGDLSYRWLLNRGDRMDSFYCIWLPCIIYYTKKETFVLYSYHQLDIYKCSWCSIFGFLCGVLYTIVCPFVLVHCIVCPSSIYDFWLLLYRWLLNRGDRMDSFYCIWLPTDIVTTMLHYTRKVWRYQRVNHIQ